MTNEAVMLKLAELQIRLERLETELKISQKDEGKKYYSIKEYAEVMDVTPQTIYKHVNDGVIEAVKVGKKWRIPKKKFE